jgi:hypothetical protein
MTGRARSPHSRGPFRADQLRSKDRYELHDGHPVYCAPTGGAGSRRVVSGAEVLETDPAVDQAGVDTGYAPRRAALYAPDVAVGNVPDAPGWVQGVPPLAVEYAGSGQDEAALATKVADLLDSGTRYLWVVRHELADGRAPYVEVHEPGQQPRRVELDGELAAPGILRNPVPVRALLEREAAHEAVLRNLVQRKGYESFEQALSIQLRRGLEQGKVAALQSAVAALCEVLEIPLDGARRAELERSGAPELEALVERLRKERRWEPA